MAPRCGGLPGVLARPQARAAIAIVAGAALAGCPAPRRPAPPPTAALAIEIGRDGGSLRGVAGDADTTYVAVTLGPPEPQAEAAGGAAQAASGAAQAAQAAQEEEIAERTVIEARRGTAVAWRAELEGGGGPLARSGSLLVATVMGTGTGHAAGLPLRGSPGAVAVGLDAATGAVRWRLALDSNDWAAIAAVCPDPGGGAVVGGSFGGTLRAGAKVVSSGGKADGFVARVSAAGEIALLVRMGGPGADGVRGVAAAGGRIAIAGTFSAGADLLGTALDVREPRSPAADAFVAELDAATARPRWAATFGGPLDDAIAGVAIDARGRVAVAGTARDVVHVNGRDLRASGAGDALVAWWEPGGAPGPALLVGGPGFDGATAIAAAGERGDPRVFVGTFTGDAAAIAALDGGAVVREWRVGGAGREEIAALAAIPGGFLAGIAHTAGTRLGGGLQRVTGSIGSEPGHRPPSPPAAPPAPPAPPGAVR